MGAAGGTVSPCRVQILVETPLLLDSTVPQLIGAQDMHPSRNGLQRVADKKLRIIARLSQKRLHLKKCVVVLAVAVIVLAVAAVVAALVAVVVFIAVVVSVVAVVVAVFAVFAVAVDVSVAMCLLLLLLLLVLLLLSPPYCCCCICCCCCCCC